MKRCLTIVLLGFISGSSLAAEPPEQQKKFLAIVAEAQQKAQTAANDMQKGGALAKREKQLCATLKKFSVKGWVGKVYSVSANTDGKGTMEIEIGPDAYVTTWHTSLGDYQHHTMMEPDSEVFDQAAALSSGQEVVFSGRFFKDTEGKCLAEISITLDGKLTEPEFVFRFSEIAPANATTSQQ